MDRPDRVPEDSRAIIPLISLIVPVSLLLHSLPLRALCFCLCVLFIILTIIAAGGNCKTILSIHPFGPCLIGTSPHYFHFGLFPCSDLR
jgi:hypothetical protein